MSYSSLKHLTNTGGILKNFKPTFFIMINEKTADDVILEFVAIKLYNNSTGFKGAENFNEQISGRINWFSF